MVVAPVVLVALALAGCSEDATAGVRVAQAGRATVAEVVEAPATVTARATATVSAAAGGTIEVLRVRDGQRVRQGKVLLRIESPDARRALREAQRADNQAASAGAGGVPAGITGHTQADAAVARAFARADRSARAIQDKTIRNQALAALRASKSQYAAARAQADQAAAQLSAGIGSLSAAVTALSAAQRVQTRAAVAAARRTVKALVVRAPIDGTVSLSPPPQSGGSSADLLAQLPDSLRSQAGSALGGGAASDTVTSTVAEGAPVSSGQPLVTVTDASTLTLTASVDETDVLLVKPGVDASAELDAVPGATYDAKVTAIDPTPTTSTRGGVSYVVRLSLGTGADADGVSSPTPRPGMSAVVDLRVRTARDVVAVPASAVIRDGRQDAVWVVKNGVVRRRAVRLGAQGASRVEVLEGVEEGERLVVRGADRVADGQRLS